MGRKMTPVHQIQFYGCMLAREYKGWPEGEAGLYVEPKLDGYRLNAVVGIDDVRFYCRHPEQVEWGLNLDHIKQAILKTKLRNCMFDGEVMAKDWNSTGIIRRKNPPEDIQRQIRETVRMHVFDVVEFKNLTSGPIPGKRKPMLMDPRPYTSRVDFLDDKVFKGKAEVHGALVQVLPEWVRGAEALENQMRVFHTAGYEGAMAKKSQAPYVFDRTDGWLKVKPITTEDLQVVGVVEGTGKYVGMMGSLTCTNKRGTTISVGGGFTDVQRRELWTQRKKLQGRILEIKMQDSREVATARSPQFVRWRPDRKEL